MYIKNKHNQKLKTMKTISNKKLTGPELKFAIKLQRLIESGIDVSTHIKIAFHLETSEQSSKRLVGTLVKKGIIKVESKRGVHGFTQVSFIKDPLEWI